MKDLSIAINSGLHDYEIADICVIYSQGRIVLNMKTPQGADFLLVINCFVSFKITHMENWGKGKYICSSDVKKEHSSSTTLLEIKLNSGDEIEIRFEDALAQGEGFVNS